MAKVNLVGALNYIRKNLQAWCVNNFVTKQQLVVEQSGAINFMNYCKLRTSGNDIVLHECTNTEVTAIKVHPNVTSISSGSADYGGGVFQSCRKLASVDLGKDTKTVAPYSFYHCPLTFLQFSDELQTIGDHAFSGSKVTSVDIPDTTSYVGHYAFYSSNKLQNITVGNSVRIIGNNAFGECEDIKNVYINNLTGFFNIRSTEPDSTGYIPPMDSCIFGNSGAAYVQNEQGSYELLNVLTVPNNVTEIWFYAFKNCSSIEEVHIPASVTDLSSAAFQNCSSLKSVTISTGLETLISNPFEQCTNLTSIIVDSNNPYFRSDGSCIIRKKQWSSQYYPAGELVVGCKSVEVIPSSVIQIGDSAFCEMGISSLTMPTSVTKIDYKAFVGNPSLSVLEYLGTSEQWLNVSKSSGWCDDTLIIKTQDKFHAADDSTVPVLTVTSDMRSVVGYTGEPEEELVVPLRVVNDNKVYVVGELQNTFYNCDNLVSVVVHPYVTELVGAFSTCTSLKTATVPTLSNSTFSNCTSLTTVQFNRDIESIGDSSFFNCKGLTHFEIPQSVTLIDRAAFKSCSGLTEITVPNNVAVIESEAFALCYNLTSVNISNSVTSIGDYAFYYCYKLPQIVIPEGVVNIGEGAFHDCHKLQEVHIPSTVSRLSDYMFKQCTTLSEVNFNGTVSEWYALEKGADWDAGTPIYTVYCTDGHIVKGELPVTTPKLYDSNPIEVWNDIRLEFERTYEVVAAAPALYFNIYGDVQTDHRITYSKDIQPPAPIFYIRVRTLPLIVPTIGSDNKTIGVRYEISADKDSLGSTGGHIQAAENVPSSVAESAQVLSVFLRDVSSVREVW